MRKLPRPLKLPLRTPAPPNKAQRSLSNIRLSSLNKNKRNKLTMAKLKTVRKEAAAKQKAQKAKKPTKVLLAENRRARHEYEILKKFEAGIVLTGTEVRSLRENNCQLTDAFALIRKGEVWIHNLHIAPFSNGGIFNHEPERKRKLLLHKKEIRELERAVAQRGMALVPLQIYFDANNHVKVLLSIARGKKLHDKRQAMAQRDAKREIDRALKTRNR